MNKVFINVKSFLKRLKKQDDGFSLLELVVAVGIILILTVGGLVAYNKITENARMSAVQSAADSVFTAAYAYDLDDDDKTLSTDAKTDWEKTTNDKNIVVDVYINKDGKIESKATGYGYTSIKNGTR